jgi:hypothetical protein
MTVESENMNVLHWRPAHQGKHFLVLAIVGLIVSYPPAIGTAQTSPIPYKHAYYLFLDGGGTGCEECYVPLLITRNALDQIAAGGRFEEGILIITYERDSIWQGKGKVPLYAAHILRGERIVRLNVKRYRYQQISTEEAVKLLENPMGTIPLSRPGGTGMPSDGPSLSDLIKALKNSQ